MQDRRIKPERPVINLPTVDIVKAQMDQYGKPWVKVYLKRNFNSLMISFEEIYYILREISDCEDQKYPNGEGRMMVARFCRDAINSDMKWEHLRDAYKIPDRRSG